MGSNSSVSENSLILLDANAFFFSLTGEGLDLMTMSSDLSSFRGGFADGLAAGFLVLCFAGDNPKGS